ncbi:hypothetical protein BS78_01G096700 [Paspalum vaginatum]|nr:hypothetical protein BS78_01G096700 [Paspalum vaginatum]
MLPLRRPPPTPNLGCFPCRRLPLSHLHIGHGRLLAPTGGGGTSDGRQTEGHWWLTDPLGGDGRALAAQAEDVVIAPGGGEGGAGGVEEKEEAADPCCGPHCAVASGDEAADKEEGRGLSADQAGAELDRNSIGVSCLK